MEPETIVCFCSHCLEIRRQQTRAFDLNQIPFCDKPQHQTHILDKLKK